MTQHIDASGQIFNCPVTLNGPVTINGDVTYADPPPGVSLDNLVDLTGTGTFQAADLLATDDLTVGGDATITGTLTVGAGAAVTGAITATTSVTAADLVATDDLTVGDDASVGGDLAVTGTLAAGATTITGTLTSSDAITVTGAFTFSPEGGTADASVTMNSGATLTIASGAGLTAASGSTVTVTGATVVGLEIPLTLTIADLAYPGIRPSIVSPFAGTITKIYSVIDRALTTGDAILTGKIGATNITDGAITITQSGSAALDVDSVTPSAANTVSVGSVINFVLSGSNEASAMTTLTILIRRSA